MSEDQVRDAIKALLEAANRPYNGNNLVDELSSRFKKALINKALQALEESKEIQTKTFGKVKIYLADQRIFPLPNEHELAELDSEIERLQQEEQLLKAEVSKIQLEGDALESQPTNSQVETQLVDLTGSTRKLKDQVAKCKSASGSSCVAAIDKKTLEETLGLVQAGLRKRRRVCTSVLQDMEAQSGIERKALYDMIGIEVDE